MIDEGYIKYRQFWKKQPLSKQAPWLPVEKIRDVLYRRQLIGAYSNCIGYENISLRQPPGFIISGSATGHLSKLQSKYYAWVTSFDLNQNSVHSEGMISASSESMTHGIFYQLDENINGVIHVHHRLLWEQLLNKVPTTEAKIAYGTPDMAVEIQRLWHQDHLSEIKVVVMAGHTEGVFTFGTDLNEALTVLEEQMKQVL